MSLYRRVVLTEAWTYAEPERHKRTPPKYGDSRTKSWKGEEDPRAKKIMAGLTFREIESAMCPKCGAGPGWPCITPTGYGAANHRERIQLAAILKRKHGSIPDLPAQVKAVAASGKVKAPKAEAVGSSRVKLSEAVGTARLAARRRRAQRADRPLPGSREGVRERMGDLKQDIADLTRRLSQAKRGSREREEILQALSNKRDRLARKRDALSQFGF